MTGNKTLSTVAKLAAFALILVLAAASCNKEQGSYRGIRFQAKSYGYLGVPGSTSNDTKTTYTGQMTGTTERIEWTNGDLIRIVSDKAYMLDDENVHQCDFCVDGHTEEGAVSSASIDPVDAANALQWRTGKHHFWAMYPSPATAGVPAGAALSSTGTMTFAIPATQVVTKKDGEMTWLPNMKQAPMLAHKVTTPSASVPLEFTPQFTAFEFTVSKGSLPGVTLTGFRLIRMDDTGFTGTLAGTYTIAFDGENGVYESTPTVTSGASTEIAIDWSATDNRIVLDADHPDFTFTVFALPETLKGLKIEFTGRFSNTGEDFTQTRSLRLRSAAGEALNFLPFLKYKIYGLSFPEMVDATIEDSINWDHSVLVMDNVIWWMNAGLDYTEWVVEDTGSRYAYLQDKLAWWIPSGIADDITWEEIKDIQLDDASDAYLWRHQSVTRTAYIRNYSNQTYSDVTVVWSAEQEGNAVHVNEHTGEVTALRPGETTVIATVTPGDGSTPWNVSYKVYVNAPTGITLTAARDFVPPSGTTNLIATVTFTSNGTIPSYPTDLLEWSSASTSYITVSGDAAPATATGIASGTATGVAEGTSTITVSVASKYADNLTATLDDFPCDDSTTITYETDVNPYRTFRGFHIARGFLQYDGSYSLTPAVAPASGGLGHAELDGMASVMAAYGTAAGRTKHYFNWDTLDDFGISGSWPNRYISGSAYEDDENNNWYIPTQTQWNTIINGTPSPAITVGTTTLNGDTNKKGFVKIVVNLDGSDLEGKGLMTTGIAPAATDIADDTPFARTNYIAGVLLIPDGATVTCPRMTETTAGNPSTSWSVSSNCISYADLEILVTGGCVFLPTTGFYFSTTSTWSYGGNAGSCWSATEYSSPTDYAYRLSFNSSVVNPSSTGTKSTYYYLVRLIRPE